MMQEYHDLFKVVDGSHKWVENTFSNAISLNLNIIVIKLLYNNHIMIVEPMVQQGLPRKGSINPLSKKTKSGNPHLLQCDVVQLNNNYIILLVVNFGVIS